MHPIQCDGKVVALLLPTSKTNESVVVKSLLITDGQTQQISREEVTDLFAQLR